jgi:hypothetical protein
MKILFNFIVSDGDGLSIVTSVMHCLGFVRTQRFGNWLFPISGTREKAPTQLAPMKQASLDLWTSDPNKLDCFVSQR